MTRKLLVHRRFKYPPPNPLPKKGRGNELLIFLGEEPLPFSGRGWGGYLKTAYKRFPITNTIKLTTMRPSTLHFSLIFLAFAFLLLPSTFCQSTGNLSIKALYNSRGLTSITCPEDTTHANLLDGVLGNPVVKYKIGPGDWLDLYRDETRFNSVVNDFQSLQYEDYIPGMPLEMKQTFELRGKYIDWFIEIGTTMDFPVTIGDLAIPVPWKTPGGEDPAYIFEQCFTKHNFISGNGSFIYFTKPSGQPPYLLITVHPGTKLEYFTNKGEFLAYIHSGHTGNLETRGSWRQPHTFITLDPAGGPKSRVKYGFRLQWAQSFQELRNLIYENGLFDIRVVPGMTVPDDLPARFSLHTKNKIDSIVAEFPNQTDLVFLKEEPASHFQYEVKFHKPGENKLTIHYNKALTTQLEFFSCEPLETLFKKRSSFIVNHQQHRDSTKWYNGLYSVYDMKEKVLRSPDNTDGFDFWWGYVIACDDPALCKAPFVAAKNVIYPDQQEIESIEYYAKNFVWGKLQRTDLETPYPYGIYGTPNWMVNRDPVLRAGIKNRNLDKMNVWRSYDYPHIIMLYWHLYQIAKMYPEMVHYLTASEYLERAYETAKAYFTYPYEILPWYETYKWGCYNELVIPELINEMEALARDKNSKLFQSASFLRSEWEKKVKYFVYDDKYPFRSEYSLDRTAFESSYALAKYGALTDMKPDTNLWFDRNKQKWYSHPTVNRADSRSFMERQLMGGLAVRGWQETSYYLLGADFTSSSDGGSMSYMANMGGWGILDYAVNFAKNPGDWLQLGYASYLCHWALMNTGTPENNYGFWFPGKENDGASGWTFNNSKWGRAWIRKDVPRGPWNYDGEIDLGYGASTRMAATILTRDSLFGWFAYGGTLTSSANKMEIVPRDGLRQRFYVILPDNRITVELDRDGFAAGQPVSVSNNLRRISFTLENRTHNQHQTNLKVRSTLAKTMIVKVNNHLINGKNSGEFQIFALPVDTKIASIQIAY